jgi:hypothetical protein
MIGAFFHDAIRTSLYDSISLGSVPPNGLLQDLEYCVRYSATGHINFFQIAE